jgi:hypothetical protein
MLSEYKLKHNLTTEAKIMADENKDLSVDEAQRIIEENKGVNGTLLPEEPVKEVEVVQNDINAEQD